MSSNYNQTAPAGTTGYNDPEGVHGPHTSRLANAADPRIDSDRDHRGAAPGATSTTSYAPGNTMGNTGTTHSTHPPSTTAATGPENTGERVARTVKGVFAQGHVGPSPPQPKTS
jgi:hypothetical protein